ncbi:MAG: YnbE family lipoprotein [Pseudomonadota bacterium]
MEDSKMMAHKRVGASSIIAMLLAFPASGCITLEAPDKPIVIELNINISQEVVYRLDNDAKALIEENEDIF